MRLPHLPDDPEARASWRVNQILWLCIAFIGVWGVCRLFGFGGLPLARTGPFGVVLLLATANLALRSAWGLHRARGPALDGRIGWVFTFFDFTLTAVGLRLTGGVHSDLWIVLFVIVLAETILSPRGEAHLIRWGAGACLVAGTWSPSFALVPYGFDIATRLFFLTVVSVITRRLRENAAAKDAELANLRAELAAAGERARLSREIHDGVGNALAAAVLRLEVAARMVEKLPEEAGPTLKEEAQALREAMNAVRDWTFLTRPWPTGQDAVPPAQVLEREVRRLSQRTGLCVTVQGAPALDALQEAARVAVLRITQEALTNIAKHAGARHTEVILRREERFLRLTIADDGCGFDADHAGPGIGLASMRDRAESLGGSFEMEARTGHGVTVTIRLPVAS